MSSNDTVAVLGTGIMGAPMARNLLAAGFPVRAWNRTGEKAAPLADAGAVVAGSPREATAGAQIVLTMLADADAVLETVADALDPGQVWLQMSTVGLAGAERCAALAAERGVTLVDAPVLGSRQAAEDGTLIVLASGADDVRERVDPLSDVVGQRTWWLGEAGTGQRVKLVANTWVLTLVESLAETLVLAEGLGVAPRTFLDVIAGGSLDSGYAQLKGRAMIERDFPPAFPLRHAAKDLRLIEEAADRHELDVPLIDAVAERYAQAVAAGLGDLDMSATFLTGAERR
ncbi:MAG TPA: NAD(P)-dependent oxidoreductase [Solirubrobacteraceae bacterium]|nr:NAD(P)-dependent oxidoreductase [Solirubrobacteraceae bacterium]